MACYSNLIDLTEIVKGNRQPGSSVAHVNSVYNSNTMSSSNARIETSNFRKWENMRSNKKNGKSNGKGLPFRILSYNILAQLLLDGHSYLYKNCQENDLPWDVRFVRLCNEINSINPDVICLQELQFSHVEIFAAHLGKIGYKYIYKQRTGIRDDGCAIFYNTKVFDMIQHESVEFRQPNTDVLDRDNIGLMAKLKPKSLPDTPIVVCTTHLLYNPKRTDVRLAQIQLFLAEIDRFSFDNESGSPQHLPVILTGDFNSLPISPVVRLLTQGTINSFKSDSGLKNIAVTDHCQHLGVYLQRVKGEDIKDVVAMIHHSEKSMDILDSDDEADQKKFVNSHKALFNRGTLRHNFKMKSVYDFKKHDQQYEATTFQDEWVTVDYIFYSPGNTSKLELVERYRLPTIHECDVIGFIPNRSYGSDHFCLAAGFQLKPLN